jgi:hypothetical protein
MPAPGEAVTLGGGIYLVLLSIIEILDGKARLLFT